MTTKTTTTPVDTYSCLGGGDDGGVMFWETDRGKVVAHHWSSGPRGIVGVVSDKY